MQSTSSGIASNLAEEGTAQRIQNVRLSKEFEYLKSINRKFEVINRNQVVIQGMLHDHQKLHIYIPKEYPFKEPEYALSGNLQEKLPVSEIIEEWVPKVKIFELIQLVGQRIKEREKTKETVNKFILLKPFHLSRALYLLIALAVMMRVIVGLGSYSGEKEYPYLGDFEAHRNWMSVTLNRPITNWYEQYEEQPWWRIDYPPVAAYLSYIFGHICRSIEPDAMRIQRGYESETLKTFMRFTALFVDLVFLFPPIYLLSVQTQKKIPQILFLVLLIKPDVILIDHGHFQYNSLILGLILMAFYLVLKGNWYWACLLYTVALHSKQMASYFSLAFLASLIGVTYSHYRHNKSMFAVQIAKFGTIVFLVSIIIWLPWLGSVQTFKSVVTAIFPIHRGLYQLKVPNFWCISDVVVSWQVLFSKNMLVFFCFCSSVLLSVPSMVSMILVPSRKSLIIGFTTISMTFFMFSYHVHEKSILLPLLIIPFAGEIIGGWFCHQFTIAGCCALFHLLKEDNQSLGYFGVVIIYYLFNSTFVMLRQRIGQSQPIETTLKWHRKLYDKWYLRLLFLFAVIGMHFISLWMNPPNKLPYLFHLMMACFSFVYNVYFLALSNLLQLEWIYKQVLSRQKKAL